MKRLSEKIALMALGTLLVFGQNAGVVRALELVVTDNGTGSTNEVQTQVETQTTVEQTNEAEISNNVDEAANTGGNEASGNTNGDVSIDTGDASQVSQVSTQVNSSQVEVGCCAGDTNITISANGSDSVNKVSLSAESQTNVSIDQTANVTNKVDGWANTGQNLANSNTGGDVSIDTGSIHVAGGIDNDPVNVASVKLASGFTGASIKIAGNGSGSINAISADFASANNTFLNFTSYINNFVNWHANTGKNEASGNTGGDVSINTGDIDLSLLIKNIANIGGVEIKCCELPPANPPGDGGNPPGNPPGGGDGDGGGSSDGGGGGGGSIGGGGSTEIAGLSDTSSDAAQIIFFWLGVGMILAGAKLIAEDSSGKISA